MYDGVNLNSPLATCLTAHFAFQPMHDSFRVPFKSKITMPLSPVK